MCDDFEQFKNGHTYDGFPVFGFECGLAITYEERQIKNILDGLSEIFWVDDELEDIYGPHFL
jgi:hypothetical protein